MFLCDCLGCFFGRLAGTASGLMNYTVFQWEYCSGNRGRKCMFWLAHLEPGVWNSCGFLSNDRINPMWTRWPQKEIQIPVLTSGIYVVSHPTSMSYPPSKNEEGKVRAVINIKRCFDCPHYDSYLEKCADNQYCWRLLPHFISCILIDYTVLLVTRHGCVAALWVVLSVASARIAKMCNVEGLELHEFLPFFCVSWHHWPYYAVVLLKCGTTSCLKNIPRYARRVDFPLNVFLTTFKYNFVLHLSFYNPFQNLYHSKFLAVRW